MFGWVKHDSESSTDSLRWEVGLEGGSNSAGVSMEVDNLSPDSSEFGVLDEVFGLGEVDHSLSEVVFSFVSGVDTLDIEENDMVVLASLSLLESNECCFLIESIVKVRGCAQKICSMPPAGDIQTCISSKGKDVYLTGAVLFLDDSPFTIF